MFKGTQELCVSLLFVQYKYIPIRSTKQHMYKTKYALLHHSRTNYVYIGIGNICMYKRHFNRKAFIRAQKAHSVEHQATNLKVFGSSPTVSNNFKEKMAVLVPSTQ